MPLVHAGGLRQYYRINGSDGQPVLMFLHSLGCDHTQWDEQAAAFEPHFRALRYDIRGHGATEAPVGDCTIEMLARDVLHWRMHSTLNNSPGAASRSAA